MLMGMAKHNPCAGCTTAVLMPMTPPRASTSGPPLLPGLSAASVWMTLSTRWPVMLRRLRPRALTTPAVTVDSKPRGLPMATTSWPTRSRDESPSAACGRPSASARTTARSLHGSAPTTRAHLPAVGEAEGDAVAAADDVMVSEQQAVPGK